MAACVYANSSGFLQVVSGTTIESCTGEAYVMMTRNDYETLLDYGRVTAGEITEAFGFGFAAVFAVGWGSTYAVRIALKLIRLL